MNEGNGDLVQSLEEFIDTIDKRLGRVEAFESSIGAVESEVAAVKTLAEKLVGTSGVLPV